ncbi:hypothetical protein QA640_17695 [Bradyrhizobium sp. CB82]|uniref:hypothetical protein n=1 Tax=Bradyrhizobium sp. CB82 TaxID=3039159 RepID=UPI0024B1B05A|nr:hypothetical protein [Bradyrhizobium sp. CB82]WFU44118.1 hypothetical protein QA640_17695 [Bradyrhizobium sp. CB82]
MRERHPSPVRRASKLIGLARDLSSFCREHQHRDLAGGMTYAELFEIKRQLADALRWLQQLGVRTPKARAAEPTTVDDEVF